jgi:hypothetical protein
MERLVPAGYVYAPSLDTKLGEAQQARAASSGIYYPLYEYPSRRNHTENFVCHVSLQLCYWCDPALPIFACISQPLGLEMWLLLGAGLAKHESPACCNSVIASQRGYVKLPSADPPNLFQMNPPTGPWCDCFSTRHPSWPTNPFHMNLSVPLSLWCGLHGFTSVWPLYSWIPSPLSVNCAADVVRYCEDLHKSLNATGRWCDSSLARHYRCHYASLQPTISHFVNPADTIVPLLPQSAWTKPALGAPWLLAFNRQGNNEEKETRG